MKFLSVRNRITFGLVSILMSVTMLAVLSGFGPDARQATMHGRKLLCESIAINSSILISQNDLLRMERILTAIVERDEDILSAAVRRGDGTTLIEIGEHKANWVRSEKRSTESQVQVPLWAGKKKWGKVELRFRETSTKGVAGILHNPWTMHLGLIGVVCFVIYSIYLRMVLRQLDPSKAIPKRVRSALDALAEGLLVTDNKGRVVLANEAFSTWAGKEPEQLIGRDARTFPWRDANGSADSIEYPWTSALQMGAAQSGHILRLIDCDHREHALVANSTPIVGQDGRYRGVLTSFEDVTELEQHKVNLSKAIQVADDANRAKSEFLARMSHEIRTPMNAILGYTEVLRRGFAENKKQRDEYLQTIHNSGEHLLSLINDILDLSKIEAGRMELELARHSPHEVVSQVVAVLRGKAEEQGLELRYESIGKLPETILTDAVRLRQAIINVVGNAIKFTETGSVRVVTRLEEGASPRLAVDVIDTGIGISEEALARIFDPFSQADTTITRRFGGTGLGLAIVRQLAEKMGGGVSVASKSGEGTTFTITIDPGPLHDVRLIEFDEAESARAEQVAQQQRSATLPPARILVVDDGEENRKLVTLFLKRAGAQVDAAENGKVAVQMVVENEYDAVLMDMQMPVMDGITATKKLRELGCQTPIIALTANVMKGDEQKCRDAGFDEFLTKPIRLDRLMECLQRFLGEAVESTETLSQADHTLAAEPIEVREIDPTGKDSESDDLLAIRDEMMELTHEVRSAAPITSTLPMDDPECRDIVAGFITRLHERVTEMRHVADEGNLTELAELAHWLKGAGGSIRFDAFTHPAAALQSAAEKEDVATLQVQLSTIEELAGRVQLDDPAVEESADCQPVR